MSPLVIVIISIAAFIVGAAVIKLVIKIDTRVENRRRLAGQLAGVLYQYGLTKLPAFLVSYSVGDYSQMGKDIVDTAKIFLAGEEAVIKEFERIFTNCLDAKLDTEEGRAYIAVKLAEAQAATTR